MTRRIGGTEGRPCLNFNVQNVFFMRVKFICFLFEAGISQVWANQELDYVEVKQDKRQQWNT